MRETAQRHWQTTVFSSPCCCCFLCPNWNFLQFEWCLLAHIRQTKPNNQNSLNKCIKHLGQTARPRRTATDQKGLLSPSSRSRSWVRFPAFPPGCSCSWNTASCLGRCNCTQAWNRWRLRGKGESLGKTRGAEQHCSRTLLPSRTHLWTRGSRPRGNVCRGRCGSEARLWGPSAAGLSAPLARCCTTESALAQSRLAGGGVQTERPIFQCDHVTEKSYIELQLVLLCPHNGKSHLLSNTSSLN